MRDWHIIDEGTVKWEQDKAITLSCQSLALSPGALTIQNTRCCFVRLFMVRLLSEMDFAQGGAEVIMMFSWCVFECVWTWQGQEKVNVW